MHHQARPQNGVLALALIFSWPLSGANPPGRPELQPVDESSYSRILRSHRGKVLLINFWATWCEPCRQEMPFLAGLAARWKARGLVLVTVSADEPEQEAEARAFLQKAGAPFPAYRKRARDDDAFIRSVDPQWSGALPAIFIYGRNGRKAASFSGENEPEKIEAAVRKLL